MPVSVLAKHTLKNVADAKHTLENVCGVANTNMSEKNIQPLTTASLFTCSGSINWMLSNSQ